MYPSGSTPSTVARRWLTNMSKPSVSFRTSVVFTSTELLWRTSWIILNSFSMLGDRLPPVSSASAAMASRECCTRIDARVLVLRARTASARSPLTSSERWRNPAAFRTCRTASAEMFSADTSGASVTLKELIVSTAALLKLPRVMLCSTSPRNPFMAYFVLLARMSACAMVFSRPVCAVVTTDSMADTVAFAASSSDFLTASSTFWAASSAESAAFSAFSMMSPGPGHSEALRWS
mmetsp:Transcript_30875/g.86951  ORF Transcript_30875/g.86951 Transcript_30875/m.86951 type:complete len:235 (+) Transcript_30875:288-992(+)